MVDEEQHDSEEEADGAHGDVGDAQEGVLSSHPRDGAEDHALSAIEAAHGIICEWRVRERNKAFGLQRGFSILQCFSYLTIKPMVIKCRVKRANGISNKPLRLKLEAGSKLGFGSELRGYCR